MEILTSDGLRQMFIVASIIIAAYLAGLMIRKIAG